MVEIDTPMYGSFEDDEFKKKKLGINKKIIQPHTDVISVVYYSSETTTKFQWSKNP